MSLLRGVMAEARGPGTVDDLARRTGRPRQDLPSELAQLLPGVVDRMTPRGRLPARKEASDG